jgi:OmpA-OmpF porin, OOP family
MKKLTYLVIACWVIVLAACSKQSADKPVAANAPATSPAPQTAAPSAAAAKALVTELDWTSVAESAVDIGNYPYFKPPEGMQVGNGTSSSTPATNGVTREKALGKYLFYSDGSFFAVEGKLAQLQFQMANGSQSFENVLFDKSYETYLDSIGAKLLFKGKVPSEKFDELEKLDSSAKEQFLRGGWRGDEPIKVYALKKDGKKLIIQLYSNSAEGDLEFVELKDFKQTVSKYTASTMQKEIEATGKAVLDINFDTDKSTLKPDGKETVNQITTLLKNNPTLKLSIEGHTDNAGTADKNKTLSNERANAVMQAIVANGIPKDSLKASGYGADRPVASNDSDINKAKNRRVELVKF